MKVRFLKDIEAHKVDDIADVEQGLANYWQRCGVVEFVKAEKQEPAPTEKAKKVAPQSKVKGNGLQP